MYINRPVLIRRRPSVDEPTKRYYWTGSVPGRRNSLPHKVVVLNDNSNRKCTPINLGPHVPGHIDLQGHGCLQPGIVGVGRRSTGTPIRLAMLGPIISRRRGRRVCVLPSTGDAFLKISTSGPDFEIKLPAKNVRNAINIINEDAVQKYDTDPNPDKTVRVTYGVTVLGCNDGFIDNPVMTSYYSLALSVVKITDLAESFKDGSGNTINMEDVQVGTKDVTDPSGNKTTQPITKKYPVSLLNKLLDLSGTATTAGTKPGNVLTQLLQQAKATNP